MNIYVHIDQRREHVFYIISRWNAVVSLQQSIETLQETIKTSQQEQKENLTESWLQMDDGG